MSCARSVVTSAIGFDIRKFYRAVQSIAHDQQHIGRLRLPQVGGKSFEQDRIDTEVRVTQAADCSGEIN